MKFNNKNTGNTGEDIAIKYLKKNNYIILEKNFVIKIGEIDIIAKDKNDIIAFIEVKTRKNKNYGFPYEAVDNKKRNKIIKVAQYYINKEEIIDKQFRFDIIEIFLGEEKKINHIKDAFWC